ncbi:hypothetical protein [Flavobacterium myungsuense]|uniref:Uncharacterized protein n=1 Tax=Flavobacterium myungsuense TaxID=651823 RepID=A0ABW3J5Z2_9FLAO
MLRIKFSAGRQFCAPKSASSPSAKPLAVIPRDTLRTLTFQKKDRKANAS